MKLKLEGISASFLYSSGVANPSIRVTVGNVEMWTKKATRDGDVATFADRFEVEVDEANVFNRRLLISLDVFDVVPGKNAKYVGSYRLAAGDLVVSENELGHVIVPLESQERAFENIQLTLSGYLFNPNTIAETLKIKNIELETVKTNFSEYRQTSEALTNQLETTRVKLEERVKKLTEKNHALTEKTKAMQADADRAARLEEQIRLLNETKSQQQSLSETEVNEFKALNMELTKKLQTLTAQNETLTQKQRVYEQESKLLQKDMEDLLASKYETEMKYAEDMKQMNAKLTAGSGQNTNKDALIQEMTARMEGMAKELNELRTKAVSNSIGMNSAAYVANTTIINTSYFNSIVNSTSTTNVHITNILQSGDPNKLREELLKQLRMVDSLRSTNAYLLSKIQDLSSNMQVLCRIRPPSEEESNAGANLCLEATDDHTVSAYNIGTAEWKVFPVDAVYGYESSQEEVFQGVEPMITAAVQDSQPGCVLTYGQTGSGKTFTLSGFGDYLGIAYRSIQKVFDLLELRRTQALVADATSSFSYKVELNLLELFNEQFSDVFSAINYPILLTEIQALPGVTVQSADRNNRGLIDVQYNAQTGQTTVTGLRTVTITSPIAAMTLYAKAMEAIANSSTAVKKPERTHVIAQLHITVQKSSDAVPVRTTLHLVDLAGSEYRTIVKGNSIVNPDRSLLALHEVLEAIEKKASNIPYGNSKLTTLLRSALGGNSKTSLILTLSPTDLSYDMSVSILQFVQSVRSVKLGLSGTKLSSATAETKNLEHKLMQLRSEMAAMSGKKDLLESGLQETKKAAEMLIDQWKVKYEKCHVELMDERDRIRQLLYDLELTQRNLRRVTDQLKEQNDINGRLVATLKLFEEELGILKSQIASPPLRDALQREPLVNRNTTLTALRVPNTPDSTAGLASAFSDTTDHSPLNSPSDSTAHTSSFSNSGSAKITSSVAQRYLQSVGSSANFSQQKAASHAEEKTARSVTTTTTSSSSTTNTSTVLNKAVTATIATKRLATTASFKA